MTRPVVTDHAVLRYLERVIGIDVDLIREIIADDCARGVEADAPSIRVADARYINSDGHIITVLSIDMRPYHEFLVRVQKGERR